MDPLRSCYTLEQKLGNVSQPEDVAIATNTADCPELLKQILLEDQQKP